jgi:hypothetical protein
LDINSAGKFILSFLVIILGGLYSAFKEEIVAEKPLKSLKWIINMDQITVRI